MSNVQDVHAVVLIPLDVPASAIKAGTSIPVVDATRGETAWAAGTTFAAGRTDVNFEGSLYTAVAASTGAKPGTNPYKWRRTGPSNFMAAFDDRLDTKAQSTGELKFVLQLPFFTGLALWGLVGEKLDIKIFDKSGAQPVLVQHESGDLYEQALGLYELLFMPLRQRTKHYVRNLPLYPDAEVHITITAAGNGPAAVGLISIGHWNTLLGTAGAGGVEWGATAAVKTYSARTPNSDGTVERVRRGSATNLSCTVEIALDEANRAMDLLHQVQGKPVAFIAVGLPLFDFLNGFGDLSGEISAENAVKAKLKVNMEGVVQ